MFNLVIAFLFFFLFAPSGLLASGTVVGNGGDPVFAFLEAARLSMVESTKEIVNDPGTQREFCQNAQLSKDQILFCHDFFLAVAPEILRLSQGLQKTLFVLRENPLFVLGPDGKPMVVAARTDLGSMGPIELHRDSIKTMLPTQVLFLITHEFQHKASFQGRSITDNERIGPFATGRDLLDSVASALVAVARKKGKVGSQFGIRDIFDCRAFVGPSQFGARVSSSRLFQSEDLMSYQTSVGRNPTDGSIYLPETNSSSLIMRFEISEPNNCGDHDPARKSVVEIIRTVISANGTYTDTVLSRQNLPTNPMCPHANPQLDIAWEQVRFTCRYFGSEGTTSAQFSINSAR